ncbi:hypothetical protein [Aquimarina celericrescens]|uniref:Uncharacterized protein n=1 Tax=Aquimarina celericrescens TaxID=1964542 RepID=A0ABW5AWA5_9FLAO|nr:hypothetical protein [Aquimarina celericrescens]
MKLIFELLIDLYIQDFDTYKFVTDIFLNNRTLTLLQQNIVIADKNENSITTVVVIEF